MMLSVVGAEDWPRFLGARDNATSGEKNLLERWPVDGLKVVWEMETGDGYTCPVIADGRLVYFHRVDGNEVVDHIETLEDQATLTTRYAERAVRFRRITPPSTCSSGL